MYVWPWRLLLGKSVKTRLSNISVTGGVSLSGGIQAARTDGGGLWLSDHTAIPLLTPDAIRCARAWSAMLDGGGTQFILPCWDLGQAPRPYAGGQLELPGSPPPSTDYFAQEPSFGSTMIQAANVLGQTLRATEIKVQMTVGTPMLGGEHFSFRHASGAWRMYRVGCVDSSDSSGQSIEIRPPLREALTGGEAARFDVPMFQAMLVPNKADELEPDLKLGLVASVNGYFMEAF